jgi:hypothetical protein
VIERTDRVNWSTLKAIQTSPRHYRHLLENPRADTDALMLGRAVHCAVYEPGAFASRYVVEPRFNRAMNDDTAIAKGYEGGKQAAALWVADVAARAVGNAHPPEIIPADFRDRALAMRDSLMADPVSAPLIIGGRAELPIEWTDARTGILCRGRIDHINGRVSDLKSLADINACERSTARYLYHAQLAWYVDGAREAGLDTSEAPCLIFVESVAPFDVIVLEFTEEDLDAGRAVYRACLDRLAECRATGSWPGVSNGAARRVKLPAWAIAAPEEEITIGGEPIF